MAVQRKARPTARIVSPTPFAQCEVMGRVSPWISRIAPAVNVAMPIPTQRRMSDPRSRTLAQLFFARVPMPMAISDATQSQITILQMVVRVIVLGRDEGALSYEPRATKLR